MNDVWICAACGYSIPTAVLLRAGWQPGTPFKHACRPRPKPPGLLRRARNFAVATARHVAEGGSRRTLAEVEAVKAICDTCPLFDGRVCTHMNCGCPVTADDLYVSKLAWASEHCPEGKW